VSPPPPEPGRRVALLDRDGTLIVDRHYLSDPDGVALMPGVAEGLRRLKTLGLGLVVVSNQSGVGRGYFTVDDMERVNDRMIELLAAEGVRPDGLYFCPHAPDAGCPCRKPKPGLVERAARELGFDPADGFMIGDQGVDMALGRAVGTTTILIRAAAGDDRGAEAMADHVCATLDEAARVIETALREPSPGGRDGGPR
jgi:D-glycero-D-manno-heptose 1,7-bisphosphate phosphatase